MDKPFLDFVSGETQREEPQAPHRRQCTSVTKDGTRCLKAPIRGGTVCLHHGGGSPQVKEKAQRTLLEARDQAAALLRDVIAWWRRDTCTECGYPQQDPSPAIRAAIAVLDRTGFGVTASLHLSHDTAAPWTAYLTNEEVQLAHALKDAAIERMENGEAPCGEVREFDIPTNDKLIWLPRNTRSPLPSADETIEAVVMETQPEGE